MNWKGEFFIGDSWMAYRGIAADNRPHAHATLQLTVSPSKNIVISDPTGIEVSGTAICVRSGRLHTLHPAQKVVLLLVEPQSQLARLILDHAGLTEISRVDDALISRVDWTGDIETLVDPLIQSAAAQDRVGVDPRLQTALEFLRTAELRGAVSKAAEVCGLSEPRLRAIAQIEMGVPLSKWLIWQALKRATVAVAEGASLADAAYAAGFADQAHYTRTMGQLMGVTPTQAMNAMEK